MASVNDPEEPIFHEEVPVLNLDMVSNPGISDTYSFSSPIAIYDFRKLVQEQNDLPNGVAVVAVNHVLVMVGVTLFQEKSMGFSTYSAVLDSFSGTSTSVEDIKRISEVLRKDINPNSTIHFDVVSNKGIFLDIKPTRINRRKEAVPTVSVDVPAS